MDNKLYEMIFKRKSFHLFRDIGHEQISDDEIKAYYKRLLECMLSLSKEYQKNGK